MNDKLKELYDASVDFKNDLASLRSQIKSATNKSAAHNHKCEDFQNELDKMFELNRELQQRSKAKESMRVAERL